MPRIFIAYRRQDSKFFQNAVYQEMVNRFGKKSIVRDIDNIPIGSDFRKHLQDEVARRNALVAVIGDRWLPLLQSRINQDIDYLRLEIEAALARDIPVVPVLVGNAEMPSEAALPPAIAPLVFRQGEAVRRDSLDHDLRRLVNRLKAALDPSTKPSGPKDTSGAQDLALRLSAKPNRGGIGIQFRWTVTIRNDGDDDLYEIRAKRGKKLLAEPFTLAAGRGRRFTFKTRYEATGAKTNSVSATALTPAGMRIKVATKLAVKVV